jgi:sugar lactone lactonase YvrE
MKLRTSTALATGLLLASGTLPAMGQDLAPAWEATGFEAPESVAYDPDHSLLYVSNIAGDPGAADGNGYISRLGLDGVVQDQKWVEGLNAPKGMDVANGRLYVADIGELVEIDTETGEIVHRYPAEGSMFLNDVSADATGRVFVSDMGANAIWLLENGSFQQWLQDEALMSPNGLLVEDGNLRVASWGVMTGNGFETDPAGHVKSVDLATKEISDVGADAPIGNLDGLEAAGDGGWFASDWMAGSLLRVAPDGTVETLADLNQGSADIEANEGLILVPMMMDGTVVAFPDGGAD